MNLSDLSIIMQHFETMPLETVAAIWARKVDPLDFARIARQFGHDESEAHMLVWQMTDVLGPLATRATDIELIVADINSLGVARASRIWWKRVSNVDFGKAALLAGFHYGPAYQHIYKSRRLRLAPTRG